MPKALDNLLNAHAAWLLTALCMALYAAFAPEALWLPASATELASEPWRLLTALFAHGNALHLVGNLLALLVVGAVAQGRVGTWMTLVVFLASGLAGNLAFALTAIVADSPSSLTGCSAAVLGLLAFLAGKRHPLALLVVGAVLATGVFGPNPGGAMAHLAGIAAGYGCLKLSPRGAQTAPEANPAIEKAARSGYASLTEAERRSLYTPSK